MVRRFQLTMLAMVLLDGLLAAAFFTVAGLLSVFGPLLALVILLEAILVGIGAFWLSRPVAALLDDPANVRDGPLLVQRLPVLAAAWIAVCVAVRWVFSAWFFDVNLPAGGLEVEVNRWSLAFTVWRAFISVVYFTVLSYFTIGDFAADLRRALFARHGLTVPPGRVRFAVKLVAVLALLSLLPMLNVLFDVTLFRSVAATYGTDLKILVSLDVFSAMLAIAIAIVFIARDLTRPIGELSRAVDRVRAGDLEARIAVASDDEVGDLMHHFNAMIEDLNAGRVARDTFAKYMPRHIATAILEERGWLQADVKEATILFTDVAGFTSIAEGLTPEQTIDLLNEYYEVVLGPIRERGGAVNNLIGDSVFASFNVPNPDERHAETAIAAALEIQALLEQHTFGDGIKLDTRIGINSGRVVAGTVGTSERMGYTLLGDEVNIASRLEELNKKHGTRILVSGETRELARNAYTFASHGKTELEGKVETIGVFSIVAPAQDG